MDGNSTEPAELSVLSPPRLQLTAIEGPSTSTVYEPSGFCVTVGRTKRSAVWLKDSAVSEQHAELCWGGERGWLLRDVGSSNGTHVNGRKLQAFADAHPLKHGDDICFGTDSVVKVQLLPREGGVGGMTLEQLISAHQEACVQALEAAGAAQAREMVARCDDALSALQQQVPQAQAAC